MSAFLGDGENCLILYNSRSKFLFSLYAVAAIYWFFHLSVHLHSPLDPTKIGVPLARLAAEKKVKKPAQVAKYSLGYCWEQEPFEDGQDLALSQSQQTKQKQHTILPEHPASFQFSKRYHMKYTLRYFSSYSKHDNL